MTGETREANAVSPHSGAAGADQPDGRLNHAVGVGRLHLAALDAVITRSEEPLSCGLVGRVGGPPVLLVSRADRARSVDVGCERVDGVWWFIRTDSGEGVVPVDEVESAPAVLVGMLGGREANLR